MKSYKHKNRVALLPSFYCYESIHHSSTSIEDSSQPPVINLLQPVVNEKDDFCPRVGLLQPAYYVVYLSPLLYFYWVLGHSLVERVMVCCVVEAVVVQWWRPFWLLKYLFLAFMVVKRIILLRERSDCRCKRNSQLVFCNKPKIEILLEIIYFFILGKCF